MTSLTAAGSQLSETDFARFCEFFYKLTGIKYGSNKRYYVDKRIAACVAASGETKFADWFSRIRLGGDPALTQAMINRLTVNETYFAREDYQFTGLVRSVLPQVLAARTSDDPIKILSLPCSTGEEVYSIAITLLETWPELEDVDVTIVGGDIDTNVIDAARNGEYGTRAMHLVPAHHRTKYFDKIGHERWRVSPMLRESVTFSHVNICDSASTRALRYFDIVFCRNLLIYFDHLSSRMAAENLFGMLRPGGYLFLGHSESMSRISPIFDPVRFPDGIAYQRPTEAIR